MIFAYLMYDFLIIHICFRVYASIKMGIIEISCTVSAPTATIALRKPH